MIGRTDYYTPPYFKHIGKFVKIYDRAITDEEVLSTYNGEHITDGLVAYYPLNEGSGNIAYDLSGNDNNGTIHGATYETETGIIEGSRISEPMSLETLKNAKRTKHEEVQTLPTDSKIETSITTTDDKYVASFDGVDDFIDINNIQELVSGSSISFVYNQSGNKELSMPFGKYDIDNYFGITTNSFIIQTNNNENFHWYTDIEKDININLVITRNNNDIELFKDNLSLGVIEIGDGDTFYFNNIGNGYDSTTFFFEGKISNFRIYDRAISQDEVTSLYNGNHVSQGLVAWYPLNGDAKDYSGNGNDGIVYGATFEKQIPTVPKFTKSASFDGVDDYIDCGNDVNLQPTEAISLSLWIKSDEPNGPCVTIIDRYISGINWSYLLGFTERVGKLRWRIGNVFNESSNTLQVGIWYYVIATYSLNDGAMKLYINGVLDNTYLYNQLIEYNDTSLLIGETEYVATRNFNGNTKDVHIYNRALSQDEVSLLYNGTHITDGLVAYYPLDGDALDYSGNGNDGTVYGATFVEENENWEEHTNGDTIDLPTVITEKNIWIRDKLTTNSTGESPIIQSTRTVVKGRKNDK